MLDLQHLPPGANVQFFTNTSSIQQWVKPRGAQLVFMIARGGGGGGAGGLSGAAGTARNGGGGGASGNSCSGAFPALLLPDMLFVRPGIGGAGGAASTSGVSGLTSYVSIHPTALLSHSNLIQAGAGTPGVSSGLNGTAGTQGSIVGNSISSVAVLLGNSGVAGGANTGANGGSFGGGISTLLGSGAGGGGVGTANTDFAGGAFTSSSALMPAVAGGLAGGGAGIDAREIFIAGSGGDLGLLSLITSATGGGTSGASGTGGAGGRGLKGSGGAGGGGGVTGGAGGRGGDGFLIIISI